MKNNKELAQQLRVGNLLYYKNTKDVAKVELIHNNHFDCRDEYGSFTPNGNYEPIPLTEEILLKLGFEFNKKYYHSKYIKYLIKLIYDFDQRILYFKYKGEFSPMIQIPKTIEYLHELQNLYHALTGQELKIEL